MEHIWERIIRKFLFSARKVDNMTSKIEIFVKIWPLMWSFSTFLGVKKVVFWTFSKLLRSSLRIVRALFLELKNSDFWSSFDQLLVKSFLTIFGEKKPCSRQSKSCFRVVQEVFGHCLCSWLPSFGFIFSSKLSLIIYLPSINFSFGVPRSHTKHRQGFLWLVALLHNT